MPAFVAGKASAVSPGDLVTLFAEVVAANSQSIAITRSPSPTGVQQPITFKGSFATTPTATWTPMGSNTNVAADYIALSTPISGNGAYTDIQSNFAFYTVLVNTYSAGGIFTCTAHC